MELFGRYCVVIIAIVSSVALAETSYTITELGTFKNGAVSSINESGQVVGWSFDYSAGMSRIYVWQDGRSTEIDTTSLGGSENRAYGINNEGKVVGYSSKNGVSRAFVWSDGITRDLGIDYAMATAINDNGKIAGFYNGPQTTKCFVWENGFLSEFDGLDEVSKISGINNAGQIVGYSEIEDTMMYRGFMWNSGVISSIGVFGKISALNNYGQVVGTSQTTEYGFIWQNGELINLDELGDRSQATSINDFGDVVGNAYIEASQTSFAYLYQCGHMMSLNALLPIGSGWSNLQYAYDINNKGQIIGMGYLDDGTYAPFLMTPVPEPGMMVLLGLAAMILRRKGLWLGSSS